MKNKSLSIDNSPRNIYGSQFVSDLLGSSKLKTSAMIILNVYDDIHLTIIKLATSGFQKGDFHVEIRNNNLFLYAEKTRSLKKKLLKQIDYGIDTFSKTFILGSNIDILNIKVRCTNGLLVIELPKKVKKLK